MNFILRQVGHDGKVSQNTIIGTSYEVVRKTDPFFPERLQVHFPDIKDANEFDDVSALLISDHAMFLFSDWDYFIMTSKGDTFERIKL